MHIVGAGPAGLAAATALRQRDWRPVVHERHERVGDRFNGDFQGIENWSSRRDARDEMRGVGLPVERLPLTPFRSLDLWAGERRCHEEECTCVWCRCGRGEKVAVPRRPPRSA